ncbi:hypothetical protein AKO1_012749 [Acrasis kona]|uniref:TLC domain-containing protein n=1 Tax=Acrasis kona TaxID=1008807 RepID=A0AAW2YWG3_9EUKA
MSWEVVLSRDFAEPLDKALFYPIEEAILTYIPFIRGNRKCKNSLMFCIEQQLRYCTKNFLFGSKPFPITIAIISFLSCFVLFQLSKLFSPILFSAYRRLQKEDDREKWNVKAVSAIHAAFVLQGAVRSLMSEKQDTSDLICGYVTELSHVYCAITFGYMFYDFIVSYRAYGLTLSGIFPSLAIHHVNIILSFFFCIKFSMGYYFSLMFMTNEVSQPFLHFSWFLIKSGFKPTHPISIINGLLLVTTFLGSRFFFNWWVFYHMVRTADSFSIKTAAGVGVYTGFVHVAVNAYWCLQMVKQIKGMLASKPKPIPAKDEVLLATETSLKKKQ